MYLYKVGISLFMKILKSVHEKKKQMEYFIKVTFEREMGNSYAINCKKWLYFVPKENRHLTFYPFSLFSER